MTNSPSTMPTLLTLIFAIALSAFAGSRSEAACSHLATACPFCNSVSQTLTEQLESVDGAVIVKLEKLPDPELMKDPSGDLPLATFSLVTALSGKEFFVGDAAKQPIRAIFFGDGKVGDRYLLTGVDPIRWNWSSPVKLTDVGEKYLKNLGDAPKEGTGRMGYFLPYLNHADPMLAQDAYEEFARAPYEDVLGLKPKLEPAKLVGWIESPDVSSSSRRLYFTLLGVCGGEEQFDLLKRMMTTEDRRLRAALDAAIACWLTLRGPEGCDLIDELFIENVDAEYADTYAAIMALRFHGTEAEIVPRERILVSFRKMLERPALADLVIPDLARWNDWSVKAKMVDLFKNADEKSAWVRLPIVNYFRACPQEDAKKILAELEKIDPEAIKRSNSLFFIEPPADEEEPAASDAAPGDVRATPDRRSGSEEVLLAKAPIELASSSPRTFVETSVAEDASRSDRFSVGTDAETNAATEPRSEEPPRRPKSDMAFNAGDLVREEKGDSPGLSWWFVLGAFGLATGISGLVQWSVLRG